MVVIYLPEEFQKYFRCIEDTIKNDFDSIDLSFGQEVYPYSSNGKKVRGILALLSCETLFSDYTPALPIAVGYECLHSASLIQDDIIDRSKTRRNQETAVKKHKLPKAILFSDIFIFNILKQISKLSYISNERICKIASICHESLITTAEGEARDVQTSKRTMNIENYIKLTEFKTGALFSGAAACGAIVGLGTEEEVKALTAFGLNQGIVFQIMDDLIDITGNPKEIGKPVFNDLKNKSLNAVLLHFFSSSSISSDRDFIQGLLGKKSSKNEILKGKEILVRNGSIDFAKRLAKDYATKSQEQLQGIKDSSAKEKLLRYTDMLLARNS